MLLDVIKQYWNWMDKEKNCFNNFLIFLSKSYRCLNIPSLKKKEKSLSQARIFYIFLKSYFRLGFFKNNFQCPSSDVEFFKNIF